MIPPSRDISENFPSVELPEDEDARERRWWAFETEIAEFAKVEGWPAVLRAVSRAMREAGV